MANLFFLNIRQFYFNLITFNLRIHILFKIDQLFRPHNLTHLEGLKVSHTFHWSTPKKSSTNSEKKLRTLSSLTKNSMHGRMKLSLFMYYHQNSPGQTHSWSDHMQEPMDSGFGANRIHVSPDICRIETKNRFCQKKIILKRKENQLSKLISQKFLAYSPQSYKATHEGSSLSNRFENTSMSC